MAGRILIYLLLSLFSLTEISAQSFKTEQQKASRVKTAYAEKWEGLKAEMLKKGIDASAFELFIRVLKHEKKVEVWLRSKKEKEYKLFKTYDICYYSGDLGPKRKQGDGQVPEGFYSVAVFNPYSSYHLSLGLSYPNASDKIIGKSNLGGDIMIHGNCLSIGCIPITDVFIKELYVLAVEARNSGQNTIPVHIFPLRMDAAGMAFLNSTYESNASLQAFWKNIQTGYNQFEEKKTLPKVSVNKAGAYVFGE
jgi:murein L,D-transpeptidase YafK